MQIRSVLDGEIVLSSCICAHVCNAIERALPDGESAHMSSIHIWVERDPKRLDGSIRGLMEGTVTQLKRVSHMQRAIESMILANIRHTTILDLIQRRIIEMLRFLVTWPQRVPIPALVPNRLPGINLSLFGPHIRHTVDGAGPAECFAGVVRQLLIGGILLWCGNVEPVDAGVEGFWRGGKAIPACDVRVVFLKCAGFDDGDCYGGV